MLEETVDDNQRRRLLDELTGRFTTTGPPVPREDEGAPAWWHGDEEAYESSMLAAHTLGRRRR
jgi:hypothetical protein